MSTCKCSSYVLFRNISLNIKYYLTIDNDSLQKYVQMEHLKPSRDNFLNNTQDVQHL